MDWQFSNDDAWRPQIFDIRAPEQRAALEALRASERIWHIHDALARQARELARVRAPGAGADAITRAAARFLIEEGASRWVYYPWSGRLVRLLAPAAFRELRLSRNRDKITAEEQARLGRLTVGVVGLSAGHAVALTLALEGACGHLKLADMDELDLSNLNRVRAGVHDIGVAKTVVLARQLMEIDPYLQLTLYPRGVTREDMDAFLLGDAAVDIVVDECDTLAIKVLLRERARALRLPVIMDTSDRGMLDVERFDVEPARPILHGRLGDVDARALERLSEPERLDLAARIVGPEGLSTRLAASVLEIGQSLATWPQLASDVTLGGASVTAAVRRIALGEPLPSGRRYIDLEDTLARAPAAPAPVSPLPPPLPRVERETLRGGLAMRSSARAGGTRDRAGGISDLARYLVAHAALAPSGGNAQPWRFHVEGARVWLSIDRSRAKNLFSVDDRPMLLALGAAAENLCIAAASRGHDAEVRPFPGGEGPDVVAEVALSSCRAPAMAEQAALLAPLQQRVTNRAPGSGALLTTFELRRLHAVAARAGARLDLAVGTRALGEAAALVGEADRIRYLCGPLHREMFGELRWTPEEAHARGDGIDVATLGMGEGAGLAALRVAARPDVARFLRARDAGAGLRAHGRVLIESASAIGMLSMDADRPGDWLRAGRAMQRLWIEATRMGLGWQPVGTVLYMLHMLDAPVGAMFGARERRVLMEQAQGLDALFPASARRVPVMMFRLARAPVPAVRALRRPVDDILAAGRPLARPSLSASDTIPLTLAAAALG